MDTETKLVCAEQYHAAECGLRAASYMAMGMHVHAIREQLIGAFHSARARKWLDDINAMRAIEICLQG